MMFGLKGLGRVLLLAVLTASAMAPTAVYADDPTYRDVVVGDGAVVLWRLGESGGATVVDDLVGNDATYLGSPFLGVGGLINDADTAVWFDGVDDNVHLKNSTDINQGGPFMARSVELWFNAAEVSARQTLYEQGSITRGLSIYLDGGLLRAGIYNTDTFGGGTPWGPVFVSTPVTAGETHHVVMTFDAASDEFRLYLDGAMAANAGGIGAIYAHGRSAIGAQWDWARYHDGADQGNVNYFEGTIDEVALYPGALDQAAVANHYSVGAAAGPIVPHVSIEAPTHNSVVSGTRNVVVNATDDDPLGSLDVAVSTDGSTWNPALWDPATSRYQFVWDTTTQLDGPATIRARATDSDTNQSNAPNTTVTINNTPPTGTSMRQQRCLERAYPAQSDPELSSAQKQWLLAACAADAVAEAIAEPQGVMAPELFTHHPFMMNEPSEVGDRFGHSLHCMAITANRFGLVYNAGGGGVDPNALGGSAPINYMGEYLLMDIGGAVRLFNRVVMWDVRPDNQPMTVKHQVLHPTNGSPNDTVARIYNPPQYKPISLWTEVDASILGAWNANLNSTTIDYIVPGKILNVRSWYDDSYCHDKRAETRIPNLVLDYAAAQGFGGGTSGSGTATRIRLAAEGDPQVAASWSITTDPVITQNVQTTNGFRWFYAADVYEAGTDADQIAKGLR